MPTSSEEIAEMRSRLKQLGCVVGDRDPNLNRAFIGKYMVAEPYEAGTATDDAGNGPFCIVGDNLNELVEIAHNHLFG